jgi:hypothetical protein
VVGCGSTPNATPDAGADAGVAETQPPPLAPPKSHIYPPAFVEGPHGAFPQAVNAGGPILTPTVVPVFFTGDGLETDLESLLSQLPASTYWSALQAAYPAVGALTVAPSVVLTDTPPTMATIDDVAGYIAGKLGSGDPAWPAITPNSVYVMYYPSSTTLTLGSATGCQGFAGYHSYWHTAANDTFIFAAIARCDKLETLDVATQNTTHEIVEATTDPLFGPTPAYSSVDLDHVIWTQYPGNELADLCEDESLSYQRLIGSYLTARFWSNTSAMAGHDPCAPAISAVYYNSVPVMNDDITFMASGQSVSTKGVSVPLGKSVTVDVQLFSDAPTVPWALQAQDASSYLFGGPTELTFTWDTTMGNNGDTVHLTITRVANDPNGGSELVIYSTQSSSSYHAYFALAGN